MTLVAKTSRVLAAILIAGALSVLAGCTSESEAQAVPGSAKAAKLKQCVRPTWFMRRNHMELIKHQRDITVHQGIRDTRNSLAACIACHVQYDATGRPVPVNAPKQFCNGCHEKLAVRLDCFECHSTVPNGPQPANLMHNWPGVFSGSESKQPAVKQSARVNPAVKTAVVAKPLINTGLTKKVAAPITAVLPAKTESAAKIESSVIATTPSVISEPATKITTPVIAMPPMKVAAPVIAEPPVKTVPAGQKEGNK